MEKKQKKKLTKSDFVRTKSGQGPSAQNATPCYPVSVTEMSRLSLVSKVNDDRGLTHLDRGVLLLLLEHGARISEVLNLRLSDLKGCDRVMLHGLKGSDNRLIEGVSYYADLFGFLSLFPNVGCVYSRWYYYRLCNKLGIRFQSAGSTKASVTHAGRHLYVDGLSGMDIQVSDLQRVMGHKSQKSTECYVEKKA
jgi:integrase